MPWLIITKLNSINKNQKFSYLKCFHTHIIICWQYNTFQLYTLSIIMPDAAQYYQNDQTWLRC